MAATETRNEVRAEAKWVRTSARKARLVTEHIRGRTVPEARTVLAFTPRAAAREVEKVLRSAVANAEANHGLIGDQLVVASANVDEGPTMKRFRARARGRAHADEALPRRRPRPRPRNPEEALPHHAPADDARGASPRAPPPSHPA